MADILELEGVRLAGISACLPATAVDNVEALRPIYGEKAEGVVRSTGIRTRRLAEKGVTPLDLCVAAAERLLAETKRSPESIGAVVFVSFTQPDRMPAAACQAQARLGLPSGTIAFDVSMACSGWGYGLYLAGLLARQTGKPALLLDGDVQSAFLKPDDAATVPVLADAGTATLVVPDAAAEPWKFAFLSNGADGAALRLPRGGTIAMDGFAIFRFVSVEVTRFVRDFLTSSQADVAAIDAFAPHQANVFMIRPLAKALGIAEDRLLVSGDEFGDSASASVPVTLAARAKPPCRTLVCGFGGGLSAYAATVSIDVNCRLVCFDL